MERKKERKKEKEEKRKKDRDEILLDPPPWISIYIPATPCSIFQNMDANYLRMITLLNALKDCLFRKLQIFSEGRANFTKVLRRYVRYFGAANWTEVPSNG